MAAALPPPPTVTGSLDSLLQALSRAYGFKHD
jgi:hypothetical protein